MNQQEMLELLFQLKTELGQNQQLSTGQKQKMRRLIAEIEKQLAEPENKLNSDQYLLNKLNEMTEAFEIEHPELTAVIGRVSDMLARMGI
jgi:hypothetical protein